MERLKVRGFGLEGFLSVASGNCQLKGAGLEFRVWGLGVYVGVRGLGFRI